LIVCIETVINLASQPQYNVVRYGSNDNCKRQLDIFTAKCYSEKCAISRQAFVQLNRYEMLC